MIGNDYTSRLVTLVMNLMTDAIYVAAYVLYIRKVYAVW